MAGMMALARAAHNNAAALATGADGAPRGSRP